MEVLALSSACYQLYNVLSENLKVRLHWVELEMCREGLVKPHDLKKKIILLGIISFGGKDNNESYGLMNDQPHGGRGGELEENERAWYTTSQ